MFKRTIKWEYKLQSVFQRQDYEVVQILNGLGVDGWEVVIKVDLSTYMLKRKV